MKRLVLLSLCVLFAGTTAMADPVKVVTERDSRQDDWILDGWVEELSTAPHNPTDQLITSMHVAWEGHIPCPTDYTGGSVVQIAITNMTSRSFEHLYYVGDVHDLDNTDPETRFTNVDELVADVTFGNAYGVPGLAFKIDAVGLNTPLVYESMTQDGIFEPGEVWKFVIQDYSNFMGAPPDNFGSVNTSPYGAIAQASWLGNDMPFLSTGSIITGEPSIPIIPTITEWGMVILGVLVLGCGVVVIKRRLPKVA